MASRISTKTRKDRLKRSLPAIALVCLFIFGGGVLILLDSVSPGRIDTQAGARIRALCDDQPACDVRLGAIIGGSWDTFFEFDSTVPQPDLRKITGASELHTAHSQRVLVLMKDHHVVRRQYAHMGQAEPLAGQVVFADLGNGPHANWVSYPASTLFLVNRCPTKEGGSPFGLHGGDYFLLTSLRSQKTMAAPCPAA